MCARPITHGKSKTRLYGIWTWMKKRCSNRNAEQWASYGGRGIKVCKRWLGPCGFINFETDMGQPPTLKHTLDRKNSNGDYTPKNCRWATSMEQAHNRSTNVRWTLKGRTLCIASWSRRVGLPFGVLHKRVDALGWSVERALTTPIQQRATQGVTAPRLDESQVRKIVQLFKARGRERGLVTAMATRFNVHICTISAVINGITWKHITGGRIP